MKFKMSTNVAIWTKRKQEAVDFYTRILGFPQQEEPTEFANIDANPLTF